MKDRNKGFTLIELITVMAIVAILAGLITAAAQTARRQALVAKARSSISALETALGMFQADIGAYPSSGNTNLITCLTTSAGCLVGNPPVSLSTSQAANWNGPYMNFQTNEIVAGQYVDPWGKPYIYTNPGTDHGTGANYMTNYVDIYSIGSNGTDEHVSNPPGDDVTNWRK